jgi:undecaprenyl diphosphate synthase
MKNEGGRRMGIFGSRVKKLPEENKIPQHIGIIMDGNGRWAKKHGLPRQAGHAQGVNALKGIIKYCNRIGVKYLTVYAFSTENWKRPQDEVENIMNLLRSYLNEVIDSNEGENVRIQIIGDREPLAADIKEKIRKVEEKTANRGGLTLNVAINYGGRAELEKQSGTLRKK